MRRSLPLAVVVALVLSGCPRQIGHDAGPMSPDAGQRVDSGYHPGPGNAFEGPISLDDERVRSLDPTLLRAGSSPCREPVLARVYSIADGDTFDARGEDVVLDARVRIIGVDTPEVAHSGTPADCYGDQASAFTAQLQGRLVWLTFDNTCFDIYDRLLAYVHVGPGEGDLWERQLLRRGLATVLTVGDNRAYSSMFEADEASASSAGAGLWSACF